MYQIPKKAPTYLARKKDVLNAVAVIDADVPQMVRLGSSPSALRCGHSSQATAVAPPRLLSPAATKRPSSVRETGALPQSRCCVGPAVDRVAPGRQLGDGFGS
ncbi:MAG: hypothetical protein M5U34_17495 [Chloroflexi bacterium]|nr:hypothetical protein [Chloroflexota bacterium]